jgi:hypothetical protein
MNNIVFFLSHNGLGDNITCLGAINFLTKIYKTVYVLCKDIYKKNLDRLLCPGAISFHFNTKNNESIVCKNIITKAYEFGDVLISGCHKKYLKSKITNPAIINYKKNNIGFFIEFPHIFEFYNDINLDLYIYYNYFNISSSELSKKNLELLGDYKIFFCHTKSSAGEINIDTIIEPYKNNNQYIVICPNKNFYNINDEKYNLTERFINLLVGDYIDFIIKAEQIHVIDSCFSCIVIPLKRTHKLNCEKVNIYKREDKGKLSMIV